MKVTELDVTKLRPYERNARQHSTEQVEQIAASIKQFGFTNPLLVDESQQVIAGHGRLAAAQLLGRATVPCIVLAGLSDAQRRALVIADNRLAENATWNFGLLASELQDLRLGEFDMASMGFTLKEYDELIGTSAQVAPPAGFNEYGEDIETEHLCPRCGYEWSGKDSGAG